MVDCGRPDLRTLPNLVNLPIYINQGSIDWLVSVANARLGVGIMRQQDVPVTYHEYAGIGHAVWPQVEKEGYLTRLATHRRVRDPDHIRLVALHPRQAAQYWARIERWIDPHHPARLDARVLPDNVVRVETSNVEHLRLQPPVSLLTPGKELVWLIQGCRYSTPWSPAGDYEIQINGDSAKVAERMPAEEQAATHPYAPGGFMELYRGEPLLIVYGTETGDVNLRQALSDFAAQASLWTVPGSSPMELGQAPALADTAVSEAQLAGHNLLLIGGPGENTLSARLMKKLPIREEIVEGALSLWALDHTFSLAGKGYGFLYPNPEYPQRLIYVLSAADPAFYRLRGTVVRFYQNDPDNPDLVILRADSLQAGQWARTVRFDQDWKPLPNGPKAGRYPHSEQEFQEMVAEAYRRAAQAPFALVRKASPEATAPYDAQAGWEEISLLLPADPLLTCEATGRQLLGLADSKQDYWWTLFPIPDSSTVDRESLYRIAGSPDLMRALARSQFAPASIGIGADADHLRAVAREIWGVNEGQLLTPGHP